MVDVFQCVYMLAQIDPAPYGAAWGILGILAFAIVVLCTILWKLFVRQGQMFAERDKLLMDFVNTHRGETTKSMEGVAATVAQSNKELGGVLASSLGELRTTIARQQRRLDEVLMTGRVLDKVAQMKKSGTDIDETVIERIVRSVNQERRGDEG